jgi:hypothetical protein
MQRRTLEQILETPIDEATAEDLARARAFYEDLRGDQRHEITRPFAQLLAGEPGGSIAMDRRRFSTNSSHAQMPISVGT